MLDPKTFGAGQLPSGSPQPESTGTVQEAIRWRRTGYRDTNQPAIDEETGLINRSRFEELLLSQFKRARRLGTVLGLLFIHLDPKNVAESEIDKSLLAKVAARIKASVRRKDIVARYGQNDLCVIAVDHFPEGLASLGKRILDEIDGAVESFGTENPPKIAIGAVCCLPSRSDCRYERFLVSVDQAIGSTHTPSEDRLHLISLVTDRDREILRGVQERLYSRFLEIRGNLSGELVREVACQISSSPFLMGRVARRMGWISPRRLRHILDEQRESHQVFGEIAIEKGYLKPEQMYVLLSIQQENPEELTDFLVEKSHLTPLQGRQFLRDYYQRMARGETVGTRSPVSS